MLIENVFNHSMVRQFSIDIFIILFGLGNNNHNNNN